MWPAGKVVTKGGPLKIRKNPDTKAKLVTTVKNGAALKFIDMLRRLRIVRTPEGEVKIDPTGKLNGRGAYVCKNKECFEKLQKTHALDKAFKMSVGSEFFEEAFKELFGEQ